LKTQKCVTDKYWYYGDAFLLHQLLSTYSGKNQNLLDILGKLATTRASVRLTEKWKFQLIVIDFV